MLFDEGGRVLGVPFSISLAIPVSIAEVAADVRLDEECLAISEPKSRLPGRRSGTRNFVRPSSLIGLTTMILPPRRRRWAKASHQPRWF